MSVLIVKPNTNNVIALLYTFIDPVHHGDPGQTDKSNSSLYRRQLMQLPIKVTGRAISQSEVDDLCQSYPVPKSLLPLFEDEPLPRFVATLITKFFIEQYSSREGEGLFSGMERYARLEVRFSQVAQRVTSIKAFWGKVCDELRVSSVSGDSSIAELVRFYSLPQTFSTLVLDEMCKNMQLIRVLAQQWVNEIKGNSPKYWLASNRGAIDKFTGDASAYKNDEEIRQLAADMGHVLGIVEVVPLKFVAPTETSAEISVSVPVPTHSGNDIRHDLRWAMGMHMLRILGIRHEDMQKTLLGGDNPLVDSAIGAFWASLPKSVQGLLENAGAIAQGAKEPATAFALAQQIKSNYPGWGAFSGSTSTFIMGAGNLESVSCFFVGKENNAALEEFGLSTDTSVSDMLDQWGLTRHAVRSDGSPMPTTFEVMQAGAQMVVRLQISPYTTDLELGAIGAAIRTFQELSGTIGGKAARGFGRVKVTPLRVNEDLMDYCIEKYEAYLNDNSDKLREGLLKGTLGTNTVVCL